MYAWKVRKKEVEVRFSRVRVFRIYAAAQNRAVRYCHKADWAADSSGSPERALDGEAQIAL